MGFILSLIPMMIMQIPLAIVTWFLSKRIGLNHVLWSILVLIPIIGMILFYYPFFKMVLYALDRLNAIEGKINALMRHQKTLAASGVKTQENESTPQPTSSDSVFLDK